MTSSARLVCIGMGVNKQTANADGEACVWLPPCTCLAKKKISEIRNKRAGGEKMFLSDEIVDRRGSFQIINGISAMRG